MAHLSDEQLLEMARDDESSEHRHHVLECSTCFQRVAMWRLAVEGLPAILRDRTSEREMHNLDVMYRQFGPRKSSIINWLASLVRTSSGAVAEPVRGLSSSELREFEAGPYTVMMETGPLRDGAYPVHGQIFHQDADSVRGAKVVVASDAGVAFVESPDQFGEFHVEVTRPGRYHATILTDQGAFRIENMEIGGSSGE